MDGKLRNMTSVYLLREDKILLLHRIGSKVVGDSYVGAAGGHFEPAELNDARACVLRELKEETGLEESSLDGLTMRYITARLKNGEVRQNYYFFARLKDDAPAFSSNEGELQWFTPEELWDLEMPFTAKHMLRHYFAEGKDTDLLYAGGSTEFGVAFVPLEEF